MSVLSEKYDQKIVDPEKGVRYLWNIIERRKMLDSSSIGTSREHLHKICFEDGYAVATDAQVMTIYPFEPARHLDGRWLAPIDSKGPHKGDTIKCNFDNNSPHIKIECDHKNDRSKVIYLKEDDNDDYVDWKDVVTNYKEHDNKNSISFNNELIKIALENSAEIEEQKAKATLRFDVDDDGLKKEGPLEVNGNRGLSIVMPLSSKYEDDYSMDVEPDGGHPEWVYRNDDNKWQVLTRTGRKLLDEPTGTRKKALKKTGAEFRDRIKTEHKSVYKLKNSTVPRNVEKTIKNDRTDLR